MGEIIILRIEDVDDFVYEKILSVLPKKIEVETLNKSLLTFGEINITDTNTLKSFS